MRQCSRLIALLLPLLLTAAPAAAQTAPLPIVTLELVPVHTPPGVPVTAVVKVTNPGAQPIRISNQVHVLVVPAQGEPFHALDDTSYSPRESFGLSPRSDAAAFTLGTGETRTFVMPADLISQPEFFLDERLSWPGSYRLRLKLWSGVSGALSLSESNDVLLTVDAPQGQDALVWNRMLELSSGRGWNLADWLHSGPALAKEVFAIAPQSSYVPYVAAFKWGQTAEAHREGIEHAIALRPEGPVADQLQGVLAGWFMERGEEALAAGDLARAIDLFAEARIRATELSRTTQYAWIRENTERWLAEELDSEPVLRGRYASNVKAMSSYTEPVTPFVECVDPGAAPGDPYIVRFGYENPNRGAKFVERGKANDLTPSAAKDRLPRVFQPGRHTNGFSVTTHADRVTWSLDGRAVTASRDTQPRCVILSVRSLGLRPVIDCVEKQGDHTVVSFGYENPNSVAIRVAAGPDNELTGSNEQQPTIFEPGRHYDVVRVKVKSGAAVGWSLAGRNVSSTSVPASDSCSPQRH